MCTSDEFAPFEVADSSPVGFKGFDIDLVRNLADDLGVELNVVVRPFATLVDGEALNRRDCDLVASAMTVTPQRATSVDFSDGYYAASQSLLVPSGSPVGRLAQMAGKRLGVQKGTTGSAYARAHATGAMIVEFDTEAEEFGALKAGRVAGILQDLPINLDHQKSGGYGVVEAFDTKESYALAVRKGNTDMLSAVNRDLAKMRRNGALQTIYGTWFPIVR